MPDVPAPIPSPKPVAPQPVAVFQVALLSDGNVSVTGPIDKPTLVMKVLGQALSACADFQARKEGARLVQAGPGAMRPLNGR